MPLLTINYCIKIMEWLRDKGFEKQAQNKDILMSIRLNAGDLPKTRSRYFQALQDFGMISKAGDGIFNLHYDKVDMYALG